MKLKYKIGALTDQQYAFKNRSWELDINNTIDIYDSLGSNIKVYVYGSEVKRILPLKNDLVNEEWISNKTRYFFEGLVKWRVNIPLFKKSNTMVYVSWIQAFYYFLIKIWFYNIKYFTSNLIFLNSMFIDYELIITSKFLIKKLGFLSYNKNLTINLNDYYLYYINPNFFEDIKNKKIFFFIGYNLRLEAPILNIKLRKKRLKENLFYFLIGSNFNDNLNCKNIGLNIHNLVTYLNGKLKICNIIIKDIKKLKKNVENILDLHMFLLGNNIVSRIDNINIINFLKKKNKILNFVSILNKNSIISNYFINFTKKNLFYILDKKNINININFLYINLTLILYEEFNMFNNIHNIKEISKDDIIYLLGINNLKLKKTKFCIFQGHHINLDYLNVDLIFPNVTFFEKSNDYLDIEGNFLQTNFILYPPIFCRNDWSILNALYIYILNFVYKIYNINFMKIHYLNVNRFYQVFNNLKKKNLFLKKLSVNLYYENISKSKFYFYNLKDNIQNYNLKINKIYNNILNNKYYNPYIIDIISEYSNVLKNCSIQFNVLITNF